jgi:serine/threonine-protein kinase HipA
MRSAKVLYKNNDAGVIIQHEDGSYTFRYHSHWLNDTQKPPISLTLPKSIQEYHSSFLFPFFYNMLPEGTNKQMACVYYRIDPDDYFGLLLNTAKTDSIGAIRILKIE